ncbi:MAG: translation initiation factor IF-2 [Candidatus Cloacimonetes bacterium]|nr:translation initiation factor IF-2 [Candidatus Cloacimonadota bacterium]
MRVHELAKELRISTAALKKHLRDLGVVVKSHMSPVEESVVKKIKNKFTAEVEAIKQRQQDRSKFQQKIVRTSKQSTTKFIKPKKTLPKREEKELVKTTPVFVEKVIKKEVKTSHERVPYKKSETYKPQRSSSYQGRDQQNRSKPGVSTYQKGRTDSGRYNKSASDRSPRQFTGKYTPKTDRFGVKAKPTGNVSDDRAALLQQKKFKDQDKEKVKTNKYEDRNKHQKAKIKHFTAGGKRKKKFEPTELDKAVITKNINKTLADSTKKKKYKKDEKTVVKDNKITINEFTSVSELAKLMDISPTEIITKFFMMGQMVTINQRLDKDALEMICAEFEFDVSFEEEYGTEILESIEEEDVVKESRSPIVTVMGHVDHGKTSILDYIRNENIIAGESGGITQHMGVYQVDFKGKKITFLDTPGHEAFAAMRSRGANITDIAIIVVAANDSVKQQTIEAIDHAKAAGVTIIIAINKIDLKEANIDKTISDLMKQNLYLEDYGGDTLWIPCSAKTGEGIDELLETILLSAEMLELKAPSETAGKGTVIESKKDSRMGTIITLLLQEGSLKKGDNIVCGATYGKIRKMVDERGKELKEIHPSDIAVLFGLNSVPKAGDVLNKVDSEKIARQVSSERMHIRLEREKYHTKTNLSNIFQKIKESKTSEIKLIVKGDTDGSVEALCDSFQKLGTDEVMVNIIRKSVGGINEADVHLAKASDALIIGFHVRANSSAQKLADTEKVSIHIYQIIYEAIDTIKLAMQGMLAPTFEEKVLGRALIKQIFRIKKVGLIAGCFVEKGVIRKETKMRLFRNDIKIYEGNLATLKHFSEEVKEVKAGSDCGIALENFSDIKENDILENYLIEEIERKL